jgi:hypothetical protein
MGIVAPLQSLGVGAAPGPIFVLMRKPPVKPQAGTKSGQKAAAEGTSEELPPELFAFCGRSHLVDPATGELAVRGEPAPSSARSGPRTIAS